MRISDWSSDVCSSDLKYAIVVAEQGSFRRAADVLNLPQSTVSRRIQILERTLGVPLFERSRTGARPTLAGERFMREAAVGAGHLREAVNEIAATKRGDAGRLRIGLRSEERRVGEGGVSTGST